MKILLTGGGTAGSVTPLLAIAKAMPEDDFLFWGTASGPEKSLVEKDNIKFRPIISGKFRRYFSLSTPIDIIKIKLAFFQSLYLLKKEKPEVVVSAGSFVSPPVIWAAKLLGIPSLVHHQDLKMSLSTRLMKPFCSKITKAFSKIDLDAALTGNPVRKSEADLNLNFDNNLKTILITGGGLGAVAINNLVSEKLLEFCNIIHITGKNKKGLETENKNYKKFEFIPEGMTTVFNKADLVISRAGISSISELSNLGKPTILIPLPDSPQEDNAAFLEEDNAAVVYAQNYLNPEKFAAKIQKLLSDENKLKLLSANIKKINNPNAAQNIAELIKTLPSSAR